jgi:hypothetical protein
MPRSGIVGTSGYQDHFERHENNLGPGNGEVNYISGNVEFLASGSAGEVRPQLKIACHASVMPAYVERSRRFFP